MASPTVSEDPGAPSASDAAAEGLAECAADLVDRPSGPTVVVLADGERTGTALVVGLEPGRVLGRVELGYQPVVAVDAVNRQLLVICSTQQNRGTALVAYSLDDLSIRWSVPLAERILTKVSAAPSVLPSVDGRYVFTYHYRSLRAGDGNAPGNTRYWIGVRDAKTGALLREVDTPQCGVGLFHQATPDRLFVSCALGGHLRAIRTDTWQEDSYHVTTGQARLSALTAAGDRYVVVTHDLWVLVFDTLSGRQLSAKHWTDTAMPVVPFFGRLAMSPDGAQLWIPTAPPSYEVRPGNAVAQIGLLLNEQRVHFIADLGAVALAHGRTLHVAGGRFGSLDRTEELDLGISHRVVSWSIFPVPSLTGAE